MSGWEGKIRLPDMIKIGGTLLGGTVKAAERVKIRPATLYPQLDQYRATFGQADRKRKGRNDRRYQMKFQPCIARGSDLITPSERRWNGIPGIYN
jgi:hypothetical protein